MVQIYSLILVFFVQFPQKSLSLEVNKDLLDKIYYAQPPEKDLHLANDNCLLPANWESISGDFLYSNTLLEKCVQCQSPVTEYIYYCNRIQYENYMSLLQFKAASIRLDAIATNTNINLLIGNEATRQIIENAKIISKIKIQKKNNFLKTHIRKNKILANFFIAKNKIEFIVDTAAQYGTYSQCNRKLFKNEFQSVTGEILERNICFESLAIKENVPFYKNKKNIIGHLYLSSFDGIILSEKSSLLDVPLYKDTGILFFISDFQYKNTIIKRTNTCLDSAAIRTTIMPKLYQKIRNLTLGIPVKKMSIKTPFGQLNSLGKLLHSVSILLPGKKIDLTNVPAYFRNEAFKQCDIVISAPVIIKNITLINLKHSLIGFK